MKEATRKLIEKAERSLQTASSLVQVKDIEFVANRAYYAMFYIAEALLHEKDLSFRKHSGVHRAFGKHLVKTGKFDQKYHRWLLESFNKRLVSDYAFEAEITREDAEEMIAHAEEFLKETKRYLSK